jgi:ribokinase
MTALCIDPGRYRYRAMIGVGGIGSGIFFALKGNHTLGREESRGGRFLEQRDYCKLHIIAHYVHTLLGPSFSTIPIGKVGDDQAGKALLAEMQKDGLNVQHVQICPDNPTLFSVCFVYPDGSGGNLTPDDTACSRVDSSFVLQAEPECVRFDGRGIALAVPEVPISARRTLLQLGTKHRFFRVASFTSGEMMGAIEAGILSDVDLLAINVDEAGVAAGLPAHDGSPLAIVETAVERLHSVNSGLMISVTAGKDGSWCWDGASLAHVPIFEAQVQSTAGAGDAHLAGTIVGLIAGLTLLEAQQLGTLVAALSVTSPHTIHKGIKRESLYAFAEESQAAISHNVNKLLESCSQP